MRLLNITLLFYVLLQAAGGTLLHSALLLLEFIVGSHGLQSIPHLPTRVIQIKYRLLVAEAVACLASQLGHELRPRRRSLRSKVGRQQSLRDAQLGASVELPAWKCVPTPL